MNNLSNVHSLLRSAIPMVKAANAARRTLDREAAPDFTAYAYIEPNEVMLSRILADFLDPRGAHGQGDVYLRAYLEAIGLGRADLRGVQVMREAFIQGQGRAVATELRGFIDILIEGRDWRVAIENKPWAGDQSEQLSRYWDYITRDREEKNCRLVYLSHGGKAPEPHSLPAKRREALAAEGLFIIQSLGEPSNDAAAEEKEEPPKPFRDVLNSWAQATKPFHVRRFLDETIAYLDAQFGHAETRSMTETGPLVELIHRDADMIEAAFHVEAALTDLRETVRRNFFETLERKLDEQEWVERISPRGERISDRPDLKWAGVSFYPKTDWEWPNRWIEPRFEMDGGKVLTFGVRYPKPSVNAVKDAPPPQDLREPIYSALSKHYTMNPNNWWAARNRNGIQGFDFNLQEPERILTMWRALEHERKGGDPKSEDALFDRLIALAHSVAMLTIEAIEGHQKS